MEAEVILSEARVSVRSRGIASGFATSQKLVVER